MVSGRAGAGFSAAGSDGISFSFKGESSILCSTAGFTWGRKSGGGVALGLERDVDDALGVAFAVVLGCTTAAFILSASLGSAGFEGLLR